MLAGAAVFLRQRFERGVIGDRAPQEGGDRILLDLLDADGDARLAEIFLRQDVGSDLRPEFRHLDIVELEDDRAVRVADLARDMTEGHVRVSRLTLFGVAPFDPHSLKAPWCSDYPLTDLSCPSCSCSHAAPNDAFCYLVAL